MLAIDQSTTTTVVGSPKDDFAVRQRLESFKLGKCLPPSLSMGAPGGPKPGHRHQRSHSRNASISSASMSLSSMSSSRSSGLHDSSSFNFGGLNSMGASISNTTSFGGPVSGGAAVTPLAGTTTSPSANSALPPTGLPSKRNSHHRRRSSVSTRHESAELMGVSVPDLPPSSSEDNINLGEKDSIRRRALWALEGKPDLAFTKVEIPELSTPDIEKMMFDFSAKPSFSSGPTPSFGSSVMGSKRDSFKLLPPSGSSKDQLHTLVEEEEEEEEDLDCHKKVSQAMLPSPTSSNEDLTAVSLAPVAAPVTSMTAPQPPVAKPLSAKPRPATLNLRPLSLTPETLGSVSSQGLPTPSLTPSPRPGLRSLSLSPALPPSTEDPKPTPDQPRRHSLIASPSPRRPVLNVNTESSDGSSAFNQNDDSRPSRRSSISYKSSTHTNVGLPTPEMTPTFSRRCSATESVRSSKSGDDEFFLERPQYQYNQQQFQQQQPSSSYRPLSASEQHFLFKSHNALLARITDLERALSVRRMSMGGGGYPISAGSSRPSSLTSNTSASSETGSGISMPGEPSDEMLAFIRDLKAERDELKKDVDGWRTRVNDLDKQLGVVAKRVENERREAWVARSRAGFLEAEKGVLGERIEALDHMVAALKEEKLMLEDQNRKLKQDSEEKTKRVEQLQEELENVKHELERERASRKEQQQCHDIGDFPVDFHATPTPAIFDNETKSIFGFAKRRGLGFTSIDSESSATDVEPDADDGRFNFGFPLKSVQEADENNDSDEEDDNELAGYEDEDDSDMEIQTSSSFGSLDEYPQSSTTHFTMDVPTSPFTPSSPQCDNSIATIPPQSMPAASFKAPDHCNFGPTPNPLPVVPPRPTHQKRASLSRTWTFPKIAAALPTSVKHDAAPAMPKHRPQESIDRFFGCLDESDGSDDSGSTGSMTFNYEHSKGVFASGFQYGAADNDAPFYVPNGVGTVVEEPGVHINLKNERRLSAVTEEDEQEREEELSGVEEENDDDMFGEIGGIRITFTPPDEMEQTPQEDEKQIQMASPVKPRSAPPILPAFDFGYEENDEDEGGVMPFNFGRSMAPVSAPAVTTTFPATPKAVAFPGPKERPSMITPPSSLPRSASPSSIPRLVSKVATSGSPPARSNSPAASAYATPPTKRGGVMPSFIPHPVCGSPSPSRFSAPTKSKTTVTAPTFIRPPNRNKPSTPSHNAHNSKPPHTTNGSTFIPQTAVINPLTVTPKSQSGSSLRWLHKCS